MRRADVYGRETVFRTDHYMVRVVNVDQSAKAACQDRIRQRVSAWIALAHIERS